jgi:hypothetical protein
MRKEQGSKDGALSMGVNSLKSPASPLICTVPAILLSLLVSCTKNHQIELWNNSGMPVRVVADGQTNSIPVGGSVKVGWPRPGEDITVEVGANTYLIRFAFPPSSYLLESTTATTYRMQIEAGGIIYVLDPWTKGVQASPPQQPQVFPLRPKSLTLPPR